MAPGTQPLGQRGADVPASTGYHQGTHGQAPRQNNKLVICTIGGLAQNWRQPWIIRDVANVRDRVSQARVTVVTPEDGIDYRPLNGEIRIVPDDPYLVGMIVSRLTL